MSEGKISGAKMMKMFEMKTTRQFIMEAVKNDIFCISGVNNAPRPVVAKNVANPIE